DETLTEDDARALEQDLMQVENVKQVLFISNAEAAEAFRARYEDDELFQGIPDDNFRHRFTIDLHDIGKMSETCAALELVEGVADVSAYEDEAAGFVTIRNVAGIVCVTLIAILFIVSVFIIANTIKLTTFDRRDEIAIMKMVGATNGFIRWPFVYEGFLLGLFSSVIGFCLQWGLYESVAKSVATNDTINLITVLPFTDMWQYVGVIFLAAGMLIGVGGSLAAIGKFLQV
ncbi:MAG: permease-like cell division protein FtsX, partial [Oscillospiraceae bacterium]|nr:permease-like cell division protein FtsX [Oscillospiraceae bacterium]